MQPRISALVFDLDGVLWDSTPAHADAFAEVADAAGLVPVDYAQIAGMTTPEAWRVVAARNGRLVDDEELTRLTRAKRSAFLDLLAEVPIDAEGLDRLAAQRPGLPWAIVTGASEGTLSGFLDRIDRPERFRVRISADDGLPSKPAPDSYLAAFDRLGVPADECVVFEDSVNGLRAADAAGALTVHIRGTGAPCVVDHGAVGVRLLACVPALGDAVM